MSLQYGGGQAVVESGITHEGYTYVGSDADLLALTADDIDDLRANFPHQDPLTDDQYNLWLSSAHWQRHLFDDTAAAVLPFD